MAKDESGFTLIEIIVVLVLVGIVAAIAAMGFVTGIQGYLFAREMAPTSQKANLAMSRLTRELMEISTVTSTSTAPAPTSISFTNIYGSQSIAFDSVNKQITINGDVLIDNVNSFTLTYYNGTNPSWSCCDAKSLSSIKIDLIVNRTDSGGGTITFSTVINPRNTGNYNAPII